MMGPSDSTTQELPADLAERLHRLAESQTAGSRPWPGVDLALRRAQRRRLAGASTVTIAGVLLASFTLGAVTSPSVVRPQPGSPVATPSLGNTLGVTTGPDLTPQDAGLTGAVGGSLAHDDAWLGALRQHLVTPGLQGLRTAVSTKDVFVLWAGDLDGARYAVVDFRYGKGTTSGMGAWESVTLAGPIGAAADLMVVQGGTGYGGVPNQSDGVFLKAGSKNARYPGLLFVTAPKAGSVEVATGRRFLPNGTVTSSWRPLTKQGGAVWVGQLSLDELALADWKVVGMERGTSSPPDPSRLEAAAAAIALPGTNLSFLKWASDEVSTLGPSSKEQPVLAASTGDGTRAGGVSALAATVLRSPGGGYLYGFASLWRKNDPKPYGGIVQSTAAVSRQPFNDPGSFMAAIRMDASLPTHPDPQYLVIAPAGATTVRIVGGTATVHNRLASLPVPAAERQLEQRQFDAAANGATQPPYPLVEVQALDANGNVIGSVRTINPTDDQTTTASPEMLRNF